MIAHNLMGRVANHIIPDTREDKLKMVRIASLSSAALTLAALSYTATDSDSQTVSPTLFSILGAFAIQTAGSLIGNMRAAEFLEEDDQVIENASDWEVLRTVQGCAVRELTDQIAQQIFLPQPFLMSTIVGGAGRFVAFQAGSHAQELITYRLDPNKRNYYDLGEIFKAYLEKRCGSVENFAQILSQKCGHVPLISSSIKKVLQKLVESKVGANIFIKASNQYLKLMDDSAVKDLVAALKKDPSKEKQETLYFHLATLLFQTTTPKEQIMAEVFQGAFKEAIFAFVDSVIAALEKKDLGIDLYLGKEREVLQVHALHYITLLLIQALRSGNTDQPTDEQLATFYRQMSGLLLGQIGNSFPITMAQKVIDLIIPIAVKHAHFLPAVGVAKFQKAVIPMILPAPVEKGPRRSMGQVVVSFLSRISSYVHSLWNKVPAFRFKSSGPEAKSREEILGEIRAIRKRLDAARSKIKY
jgi:hypothetical protein